MTITAHLAAAALVAFGALGLHVATAAAEVRFGKNVRIGGHDVSHQTFNGQRRGHFYIHDKSPRTPGCKWVTYRDGSRTKVCHLRRKTR